MIKNIHIKFLAVLVTGCFFLSGCENTEQELAELSSTRIGVEEGKDIIINYSTEGSTKARLIASVMRRFQDSGNYVEFPKGVHGDFFGPTLQIETTLDSRFARYTESESKVFLRDSVKLINTKGDTLYCNELYWDRNRKGLEFFTDKPIRIRTREYIFDGEGLDAPQDFKSWHIVKPTGFMKIKSSEFPN